MWKPLVAVAAVLALGVTLPASAGAPAAPADMTPPAPPPPPPPGTPPEVIPLAPAFTGKDLTTLPRENWVTNGGTTWNQRFSPLDGINKSNVAGLKAVWRASLKSGTQSNSGNQGQPLVYNGIIFVSTGENDAIAVSVETGQLLWTYKANIDPRVARPCCSWAVRGLGMGEGKIFVGRLDARLVALDQATGKVIWDIQAEDPKLGYAIASAPLYYDGMVITGFAGSDMGTRGRIKAYDAKTGALKWTFYTVPGPGEFGHNTWPQDSEVWKYGGAAIWQTPSIDPELGTIFFSTANPGPVLNGALRKGDNLFSASIVALDVKTGKYKWHFQQVHHDIWDYDMPNPTILFDAPYGGRMRKGIAQAGKTGWVYLLDRTNGKPLVGIVERPVMQLEAQHTSKTQPYPIGDALVPQEIDIAPEGMELVNNGKIFTPFHRSPVFWKPLGAVNWPPSSYDPRTYTMYVCAADSSWGAVGGDPNYPVVPGALYSGSVVQRGGGGGITRRGVFAAVDVRTNKLVWRQAWTDNCYAGVLTNAGGLVFIGRADGRITAMDSATGRRLWQFQVDGGPNAPMTMFEWKGKQYLLSHAGGTSLGGTKRADGLWLFALDGTINSMPPGSADPAGQFRRPAAAPAAAGAAGTGNPPAPAVAGNNPQAGAPAAGAAGGPGAVAAAGAAAPPGPAGAAPAPAPARPAAPSAASLSRGKDIFTTACVVCHGENGQGGTHGGAPITKKLTRDQIIEVVAAGRNDMPAFGAALSPQQMDDLVSYAMSIAQ